MRRMKGLMVYPRNAYARECRFPMFEHATVGRGVGVGVGIVISEGLVVDWHQVPREQHGFKTAWRQLRGSDHATSAPASTATLSRLIASSKPNYCRQLCGDDDNIAPLSAASELQRGSVGCAPRPRRAAFRTGNRISPFAGSSMCNAAMFDVACEVVVRETFSGPLNPVPTSAVAGTMRSGFAEARLASKRALSCNSFIIINATSGMSRMLTVVPAPGRGYVSPGCCD